MSFPKPYFSVTLIAPFRFYVYVVLVLRPGAVYDDVQPRQVGEIGADVPLYVRVIFVLYSLVGAVDAYDLVPALKEELADGASDSA